MKIKLILKFIFVLYLFILLICLFLIAFHMGESSYISIVPVNNNQFTLDYKILDKTQECIEAEEVFYKDLEYTYYFTCEKSKNIYLEWNNGEVTLMTDDLNSGKVSINSLIDHGLEIGKRNNEE